ncbi:interleukin 19 like isoform X1 [Lepisosteus oculatus]|uniref:Interleukin family protein n=1 Tax=Lepisosteus oculatus TaxID=7918 RepID=W5N385_LEPOC|nr:PREDICTED: interleukin-20 isoform X1 [Lepisosteus oculatus]
MRTSVFASCLLSTVLLAVSIPSAAGHRLHLGSCAINIQVHELREYFNEIRQTIVREDDHMGVRLLMEQTMNVQPAESCCFLRHLLRFYVENVFSHYSASSAQVRRRTSSLANSFLSIKRDLRQCHTHKHCQCEEETQLKIKTIQTAFDKMNIKVASVKAIGELDFLLDWLEKFHHN